MQSSSRALRDLCAPIVVELNGLTVFEDTLIKVDGCLAFGSSVGVVAPVMIKQRNRVN